MRVRQWKVLGHPPEMWPYSLELREFLRGDPLGQRPGRFTLMKKDPGDENKGSVSATLPHLMSVIAEGYITLGAALHQKSYMALDQVGWLRVYMWRWRCSVSCNHATIKNPWEMERAKGRRRAGSLLVLLLQSQDWKVFPALTPWWSQSLWWSSRGMTFTPHEILWVLTWLGLRGGSFGY